MASGAITALRRAGLRFPEDVAVTGFDDSGFAAANEPPLTAMRQPWDLISEEMVSPLLDTISGRARLGHTSHDAGAARERVISRAVGE